jgi:hypothetical protein
MKHEYIKNEKIEKYKNDFIKIHKKQLESEHDKDKLFKRLTVKYYLILKTDENIIIKKSLNIGKINPRQILDRSFMDDCNEDSFFIDKIIDKKSEKVFSLEKNNNLNNFK